MKYHIVSFFYKILCLITCHKWIGGILYRSRIYGIKQNTVHINKAYSSSIKIIGINNNIIIDGTIEGCKIVVEGDNNYLRIGRSSHLDDCEIFLRGVNSKINIGDNTTIHSRGKIVSQGYEVFVEIGADCLFSEGVDIWNSDTHIIYNLDNMILNHPQSIEVGRHVWLGKGVSVLKGVKIDSNSILEMGSLVTTNIPANSIAVGNPAKVIRSNINWNKNFVF